MDEASRFKFGVKTVIRVKKFDPRGPIGRTDTIPVHHEAESPRDDGASNLGKYVKKELGDIELPMEIVGQGDCWIELGLGKLVSAVDCETVGHKSHTPPNENITLSHTDEACHEYDCECAKEFTNDPFSCLLECSESEYHYFCLGWEVEVLRRRLVGIPFLFYFEIWE